jgi:hypothetical protein
VRAVSLEWEAYRPEVFKDILDIHLVGNLRLANAFRHDEARLSSIIERRWLSSRWLEWAENQQVPN